MFSPHKNFILFENVPLPGKRHWSFHFDNNDVIALDRFPITNLNPDDVEGLQDKIIPAAAPEVLKSNTFSHFLNFPSFEFFLSP